MPEKPKYSHPMSAPWLDWLPMADEPHGYELVLYLAEDGEVWTGNHPEGRFRGHWKLGGGGWAISKEPIMWAHIPLPEPR